MASGDTVQETGYKLMTFTKCQVPFMGTVLDYIDTSLEYFRVKTLLQVERLDWRATRTTISKSFIGCICFLLAIVSNVKFEVVTLDEEPLGNDLHYVLLSADEKLYVDDIDVTKIMWCVEASDFLAILISCALIFYSWKAHSPLSEYLFLPWLGITLRGLFLRQAPTAAALIYTIAVVQGTVSPLFLTGFTFLFLLQARLWLEIGRLIRSRLEKGDNAICERDSHNELQTLWSNDEDVQSVQVRNYFY